jgi:hypothetical protein
MSNDTLILAKNGKYIIFNDYQKMNDIENHYMFISKVQKMMYRKENSINN